MKDFQNLIALPLRRTLGHAVPTTQAVRNLVKLGPVVEMGAGSGYRPHPNPAATSPLSLIHI